MRDRTNIRAVGVTIAAIGLILVVLVGLFALGGDGLNRLTNPPTEELSVDSVRLPQPGQVVLTVTNDGQVPVTIAQVLVDDAYWQFEITPEGPIDPLETARLVLPYPWVEAEAHAITMITGLGATFEAEIPVAVQSPTPNSEAWISFGLVGLYVGVLPVLLGVLLYPALRRLGNQGINFILAVTLGLLMFLAVDTWLDALETARELPEFWQGVPMVVFVALISLAVLIGVSNSRYGGGVLSVAYMIAVGIGLHNLGEGLAIGSAYALGAASLGRFLILGFAVHNVTEGIGIAAPLLRRETPKIGHFLLLVTIAGLPAVAGTWIGGFSYSPILATVFLSVGVGAILQVIYSVGRLLFISPNRATTGAAPAATTGTTGPAQIAVINAVNVSGVFAGVAVMYLTAFLIQG